MGRWVKQKGKKSKKGYGRYESSNEVLCEKRKGYQLFLGGEARYVKKNHVRAPGAQAFLKQTGKDKTEKDSCGREG